MPESDLQRICRLATHVGWLETMIQQAAAALRWHAAPQDVADALDAALKEGKEKYDGHEEGRGR